jgi:hypothetical protein
MATPTEILAFYDSHYDTIGDWRLTPRDKVVLGDVQNRRCRFCGGTPPDATFRKVAHAIPEALGNKSIETAYECDDCNGAFGRSIENDLGNWSKPLRTLSRIRGKTGVPTLKKGGDTPGWRIEFQDGMFKVKSYEESPVFELDENLKQITFTLKRDAYTPVAVLKALSKIGLTLLPDEEVGNFVDLMAWVNDKDHSRVFADKLPVLYAFQPGPMPNDIISARILRRKSGVVGYPYGYLVLGYGNEVFQVQLPSAQHDAALNGKPYSIHPYPALGSPDPARYGSARYGRLDFTGRDVVRGETTSVVMSYEAATTTSAK